jgi:hypothetical protein
MPGEGRDSARELRLQISRFLSGRSPAADIDQAIEQWREETDRPTVRALERERDKLRTCMTLDRKTIERRTEQRDRYKDALEAICGKSSAHKSPRQRLIDVNHALKRLARAALSPPPDIA